DNSRYSNYKYDSAGRAFSSTHAGGALNTTVVFNGNGTSTVTDALGQARTHSFNETLGSLHPASVSSVCSQCGTNSASKTFDSNGNVDLATDFNGNVTNYGFDLARNLETSRTEA